MGSKKCRPLNLRENYREKKIKKSKEKNHSLMRAWVWKYELLRIHSAYLILYLDFSISSCIPSPFFFMTQNITVSTRTATCFSDLNLLFISYPDRFPHLESRGANNKIRVPHLSNQIISTQISFSLFLPNPQNRLIIQLQLLPIIEIENRKEY